MAVDLDTVAKNKASAEKIDSRIFLIFLGQVNEKLKIVDEPLKCKFKRENHD